MKRANINNMETLIEIRDDDPVAGITGGVSPWLSTVRLATTLTNDPQLRDGANLTHLSPTNRYW